MEQMHLFNMEFKKNIMMRGGVGGQETSAVRGRVEKHNQTKSGEMGGQCLQAFSF